MTHEVPKAHHTQRTHERPDGAVTVHAKHEGGGRRARRKLHRMEIERADNGGFIARHHYVHANPEAAEKAGAMPFNAMQATHALKGGDELTAHVAKHFGLKGAPSPEPGEEAAEE